MVLACEHCKLPAQHLIFDAGPHMFILACDEYENDVARMEGEMELDEIGLDFATAQEVVTFLNKRLQDDDERYRKLLDSYVKLQEQFKELGHRPDDAPIMD